MSIVLFFLLSGFFLAALIGAIERSRKLLGAAGACLVVIACIIVFVKPVQIPTLSGLIHGTSTTSTIGPPGDDRTDPATGTTTGPAPTIAPAATTLPAPAGGGSDPAGAASTSPTGDPGTATQTGGSSTTSPTVSRAAAEAQAMEVASVR